MTEANAITAIPEKDLSARKRAWIGDGVVG